MVFELCIYIHKEWDIRSSALLKKKKRSMAKALRGNNHHIKGIYRFSLLVLDARLYVKITVVLDTSPEVLYFCEGFINRI